MIKPVLILSDTHYHNFHQYAQTNKNGLNTRLVDTLRASGEAVEHLRKRGGDTVIHCGDMFHVRGAVSPTVLNPVLNFYGNLVKAGMKVYVISGNHDLETNDAHAFASMASALKSAGVTVINNTQWYPINEDAWVFVPWLHDLNDLRREIAKKVTYEPDEVIRRKNLVIHAPLNGVIDGLPDHGLNPKDFEGLGYDNVFVGHYHNHRLFLTDDGATNLYSVGALTHQNWGDVNSRAGYIIYDNGVVTQHETSAPRFLKVEFDDLGTSTTDLTDNYVKVVGGEFDDPADIETVRQDLILKGAKAVIVEGMVKRPAVTRAGTIHTGAPTLHTILGDYIDRNYAGEADLKLMALEILGEVYD